MQVSKILPLGNINVCTSYHINLFNGYYNLDQTNRLVSTSLRPYH